MKKPLIFWGIILFVVIVVAMLGQLIASQERAASRQLEAQERARDEEAVRKAALKESLTMCINDVNKAFTEALADAGNIMYEKRGEYAQGLIDLRATAIDECQIRYSD